MSTLINIKNYKTTFLNLLLSFIPLNFIVGSLFINMNIVFFIIFFYSFFHKKIYEIKLIFIDKIVLIFFGYTIFVSIFNLFEGYFLNPLDLSTESLKTINYFVIYKSFFFLRYLLLYFAVRYMVENNLMNFKWFFLSSSFFCLFVSLDIFYQFFLDKDIFGFKPVHPRKLSGPFGDELIAGGYIQRFFLFTIFAILTFFTGKKGKFLILFSLLIFFVAIILSGNRMPLLLFGFIIFLLTIFEKKLRAYLISFLLVIVLFSSALVNSALLKDTEISMNYSNLLRDIKILGKIITTLEVDRSTSYSENVKFFKVPEYFLQFETFHGTWLMNKYTGGGIRSFRFYCGLSPKQLDYWNVCSTHPHNYYLEILTDLGLVGLIIVVTLFLSIIYHLLKKKKMFINSFYDSNLIKTFIFIFIAEIFPLKSTGSFFTTFNATFLFLIIAILVGLNEMKKRE